MTAPGPYRLEIKKSALKVLHALPLAQRRRLDAAILSLSDDPRPAGCRSIKGEPGLYRVRVGDFRIVYQVRDRVLVVLVIRIGDRKDVYRGL